MKPDLDNDLDVCNLTLLSASHFATLAQLQITPWQEIKGGSFTESLEAWHQGDRDQVLGFCFLLNGNPIGMTLFKRPPLSPAWVSANAATIHGLKIAKPWQERGLGHKAFALAVRSLKEEWPTISTLMLGVDTDNVAALAIYRAFGMVDIGPIFEGRYGPEHRLEISLAT